MCYQHIIRLELPKGGLNSTKRELTIPLPDPAVKLGGLDFSLFSAKNKGVKSWKLCLQ